MTQTTLPTRLWDPLGFPQWAYVEEITKSQQIIAKRKREESSRVQRESIDFVNAGSSDLSSKAGTNVPRGSAAERVMAGLDREQRSSSNLNAEASSKKAEH